MKNTRNKMKSYSKSNYAKSKKMCKPCGVPKSRCGCK